MEGIECSTNESLPFINVADNQNWNHKVDFSTKRRRGGGVAQINLLQETYRESKMVRSKIKICNKFPTRTRVDQHKCLPHLACINPTPLLFLKIVVNSKNDSEIWKKKKKIHWFVELVNTNPLIYNTLHFDQYPGLAIRLNIFRFSEINSKTNFKFENSFPLVCIARWDESIDA